MTKKRYRCKCGKTAIQTDVTQSSYGKTWNLNACYCKSCKTYYRIKSDIMSGEIKLYKLYRNRAGRKKKNKN